MAVPLADGCLELEEGGSNNDEGPCSLSPSSALSERCMPFFFRLQSLAPISLSVTNELAPKLGPETFVPQFISPEEGTRPDCPFPDKGLPVAGLWPSPWKKTPEADEDHDKPPPSAILHGGAKGVPAIRNLGAGDLEQIVQSQRRRWSKAKL